MRPLTQTTSTDPSLWKKTQTGDNSARFGELKGLTGADIDQLAARVVELLNQRR